MKYYFAYGADLNGEEFEKECPSLEKIASARLDDYEFFVDESGVPNIKKFAGGRVYGGIWEISDADFERLYLLHGTGIKQVHAKTEKRFCDRKLPADIEVFARIRNPPLLGICTNASLQDLFYGALDFSLPEFYIEYTQRFYAKHVFVYSELLRGYANDYIAEKMKIKMAGIAQTCEEYFTEKTLRGEPVLNGNSGEMARVAGILYRLKSMRQLDFFDGIFANRKFFRRYPIRVKKIRKDFVYAWCYFKEESSNLGILEVME